MKRFKIIVGITILFALLILVISSVKQPTTVEKTDVLLSAEQIRLQQAKARNYLQKKEKLEHAIGKYFDKAIKSGAIVGAGVSIVQGDSIIISDGFGKRNVNKKDVNKKDKINGETVFRLGSLSKGFAGVLTADLKEEGKLNWNDKITDYIPDFHFGDDENTSHIKLAHILSHTSGTAYHSYTNLVEAGLSVSTIAQRFTHLNPISAPGQQYSYQNAMFSLSQEVIKKVTGNDITAALRKRFFKPLGMSTVSMNHKAIIKNTNVALPHAKGRKGWRSLPLTNKYYNAVAAGGINASSLDMAKWMRFLLGHNPQVMNKSALKEVFTPFVEVKGHSKYYQKWAGHIKSAYGFGWRIHEFKEKSSQKNIKVYHHGGSVNNYRNEIAIYPESDLGICVLLNSNSKIARTVIPDLRAIVRRVYKSPIKEKSLQNTYAIVQNVE
ncbi:beta-lactamase class C [Maribacter vaceletii]|uniref:Beta-lactamase class C n=1 Tax=Maribacter vaceletii TaxID=1206816 RepID=A0A495E8F9_9FLAO|nr:serine hydrolase domain-containing protein [Maribacter vaceletii]RKR13208.1 beta-lactamase class C [Maribacter vaceletii]